MKVQILSLFPEMFMGPFNESIIKRAKEKGVVDIQIFNLRDWAFDKHKVVDDRPYGGGAGMILKVDVIDRAIAALKGPNTKVILMDAGGIQFTQQKAVEFSKLEDVIIVCGHYEGIDHRVHEHLIDEIISVGPYVLSGGEIPAMTITDAITRLIPGALGNIDSLTDESHNSPEISEYPQYTRPEIYNGWSVPKVLLEGNHKLIKQWQNENVRASYNEPQNDSK